MTKTILLVLLIDFIIAIPLLYLNIYIIEKLYLEIILSIIVSIPTIYITSKMIIKKSKEIYKDR
jgi:hypothetical protein